MTRPPGRQRATGAYPIDVVTIDVEHFRRFVDHGSAEDVGGHHWWTGRQDKDGYGIYSVWDATTGRAVKYRAHRVAYALAHGGLAAGVHVLHRPGCEDPGCVNDQHTYSGSPAANAQDRDRPARRAELAARRQHVAGQDPLPGMGWEWGRVRPAGPQGPGQTQSSRLKRSTQSLVWSPSPSP